MVKDIDGGALLDAAGSDCTLAAWVRIAGSKMLQEHLGYSGKGHGGERRQ